MNEKKNRIALVTVALGLWQIALTLTFGYRGLALEISDLFSGLLLILFGSLSLKSGRVWSGWAVGLVGVWLQMAPLFFWCRYPLIYINDTFLGAIAIVFAFLLTKKQMPTGPTDRPIGWSFNPSSWSHRIPTVALAMLCWFFSRYMAAFQLGYIDHVWDPFFPDGTLHVITSKISKAFPVPDAGLGALCYTLEALLGWQGNSRRWAEMPWLVCAFAFLVIPVGIVSITLIILQPVIVGAWCSWCLATAAFMLLMIVLTASELVAVLQFLQSSRKKGNRLWTVFWNGGKPERSLLAVKPRSNSRLSMGITFPWNLLVCAAMGIWLMASPAVLGIKEGLATANYIEGPMIVAASIIALAEVFRSIRFVNILFGAALLLVTWFSSEAHLAAILNNSFAGLIIIALSFRRGKICERYGIWDKKIR